MAQFDLRQLGWTLDLTLAGVHPLLCDGRDMPAQCLRARTIAVGVDDSHQRIGLIAAGCADVCGSSVTLEELAMRVSRSVINYTRIPRSWHIGPLTLDLIHRDAQTGGRWMALRPREFELLWRLAEARGRPISRKALLRDVWRLHHDPGTNSVEVHISRLRARLAQFGVEGLVRTDDSGGYLLHDMDRGLFGGHGFPDPGRYVITEPTKARETPADERATHHDRSD